MRDECEREATTLAAMMDFGASEAREGDINHRDHRVAIHLSRLCVSRPMDAIAKAEIGGARSRDNAYRARGLRAHAHSSEKKARGHECVDRWFDEFC